MRSKNALYNIVTYLILQAMVIVYGFVVPKIIITTLGSSVNGLISSISQFLTFVTLLEFGFCPVVKSALYKPIADKDDKSIANILKASEKFFRRIALVFLIYILLLCVFYPLLINQEFDWIFTASLILIIGLSSFAEYFFGMTYKLFLQAKQKTYLVSIIQIVTYILAIIAVIIVATVCPSVHIIKLVCCLIFLFRPLLQNYIVKKKYHISLKDADDKFDLKQKWDGLAQHLATVIHNNTDVAILTIFTNLKEVSVYSVYYLVVKGLKQLLQSFINGVDSAWGDMIAKNEKEVLNKSFNMYEVLFNTISTILFTCAIVLIVPFVSVYTKGVEDANYIRYTFGALIVISEYVWAIRLPYYSIIYAAGHFKETKKGAWVECFTNILISIVLVWKFGLIGVAIGTLVSMTIRTVEFVYHTNKYILNRSILESVKKILLVVLEALIIVVICRYLPFVENTSYINWAKNGLMVGAVAFAVSVSINGLVFKEELKQLLRYFVK